MIKSCKLTIKCSQRWEQLEVTNNPRIRVCESCERMVVHCQNPQELMQAAIQGECAWADFELPERQIEYQGPPRVTVHRQFDLLGMPAFDGPDEERTKAGGNKQ